jgi:hypothetical protein
MAVHLLDQKFLISAGQLQLPEQEMLLSISVV